MAFFTEQMEVLANELLTSRHDRAAFVSSVQERSHKLLADAQTFMHILGQEHGAMAERLRSDLAANGQERVRLTKAQRQQNREQHQSMRAGLQEMLAHTRSQRQQHIAELRTECRRAQKDLISDLRQAAQVWQRMFQACEPTNNGHKSKRKVTASATASQARPPVKAVETSHPQDHGRGDSTESTHPTHAAPHGGHHGKAKEPHHSH